MSMRFHRVTGSESLSAFLRFSRVLSGSPMFFECPLVFFQGSSRSPKVLYGSVRVSKVLNGPLWLSWVRSGSLADETLGFFTSQ